MNSPTTALFITIDVEDKYYDVPRLITGEGVEGSPGVFLMMDLLERHGFSGLFFVNVYEHERFAPGRLREVVEEIARRGHQVGLHTHYHKHLDFFCRPIFRYWVEEQEMILRWGSNLIAKWTGSPPLAHRGGGFCANEDTLRALHAVGIPVDFSRLHSHKNVRLGKLPANIVSRLHETVTVPITYVERYETDGRKVCTKFDIEPFTLEELLEILRSCQRHRLSTVCLMMHSFSFLRRCPRLWSKAASPDALFQAGRYLDHVDELFGPAPGMPEKFDALLASLKEDITVRVPTVKDWLTEPAASGLESDHIPVVRRTSPS